MRVERYISDENGKTVSSIHQMKQGDVVTIFVKDGSVTADIREISEIDYGEGIS